MGTEADSSIFITRSLQSEILGQPVTQLTTCFHARPSLGLFYPEDGGDIFFRNIGWLSTDYTVLYLRKRGMTMDH
jgi:hypothetical protein